jgi:hypothetical protein
MKLLCLLHGVLGFCSMVVLQQECDDFLQAGNKQTATKR